KECDVVIGNSSSAMNEAPTLGKAAINIGDRQMGRDAPGVRHCALNADAIIKNVKYVLSPTFQNKLKPSNFLGKPGKVAPAIAEKLATVKLPATPRKAFHDISS